MLFETINIITNISSKPAKLQSSYIDWEVIFLLRDIRTFNLQAKRFNLIIISSAARGPDNTNPFSMHISSHEFDIPLSQDLKVFRTKIFIRFLKWKFHYLSLWLGFNFLVCKDKKLEFISSKFPWIYEIEKPLSWGSWLKGFLLCKSYGLPCYSPKK